MPTCAPRASTWRRLTTARSSKKRSRRNGEPGRASAADLKFLHRLRQTHFRNFKSKSGTRIIGLLVPLCFRSSCQGVPRCITNFGSGALAHFQPEETKMANPAEDRTASLRRDVETAGSHLKKEAETAASRVGEEFQRAKEQISETAAAGRDDLADDLRKLSEDVSSLKDTVAELAKVFAAEIGEAASGIGAEVASSATEQAVEDATDLVREGTRKQVFGAILVAAVAGFLIGRRL